MSADQPNVPYGFCHCGCGQKTNIAAQTISRRGWVKDEPVRFIRGHWARVRERPSPEELFWEKVEKRGPDECWEWTGVRDASGYGQFWDTARRTMGFAHRFAYGLLVGQMPKKEPRTMGPKGVCVLHRCDNPPCVNPNHLFLGTHQTNMTDMNAKGQQVAVQGEHHPHARLTQQQVVEVRDGYTGRYGEIAVLARQYGVNHTTMSRIVHRRSWASSL